MVARRLCASRRMRLAATPVASQPAASFCAGSLSLQGQAGSAQDSPPSADTQTDNEAFATRRIVRAARGRKRQ
ncbi:protein of unknown function [Paraburkholderia kururiensis]